MSKRHTSQPGFTLIELLITSVLFIAVAGLTSAIFAGVGQLQVDRKNSQALAAQLRQLQDQINQDFRNAKTPGSGTPTVGVRGTSLAGAQEMLAIHRGIVSPAGVPSDEWRVYCKDSQDRLVRFRLPYTGTAPVLTSTIGSCDAVGVKSLFNAGASWGIVVTDELTDTKSQVKKVVFTIVKPAVTAVDPAFDTVETVNALRIEVQALDSKNDPSGSPVVLRTTINRMQP